LLTRSLLLGVLLAQGCGSGRECFAQAVEVQESDRAALEVRYADLQAQFRQTTDPAVLTMIVAELWPIWRQIGALNDAQLRQTDAALTGMRPQIKALDTLQRYLAGAASVHRRRGK
jgi:hypothetical protein